MTETCRSPPLSIRVSDRAQQVAVEPLVAAPVADILLGRFLRQVHQPSKGRFDGGSFAKISERLRTPGAGLEIIDRTGFPQSPAQPLYVANQLLVRIGFGVDHQLGERTPNQLLLRSAFDRLKAGHDARFCRESGEK